MPVRVGIDLVAVADVERSLARYGDRYLARLFTSAEVAACTAGGDVDAARLAARFAAKEATMKVLRDAVNWTLIEVLLGSGGAPRLVLHGPAALRAQACDVVDLDVSLSHEAGLAAAVVVAEVAAPGAARQRDWRASA